MEWKRVMAAGLLVLATTGSALAAAELSGEAAVGVYSKYLWRGYDFGGDADYLVQPEANFGLDGLSLGVWGNYNEATAKLDEVDATVEYSRDLGETVAARLGHISYLVVDAPDTAEVYAGLTLSLPVELDVAAYYDYDEGKSWFATLGISKEFELQEELALTVGASLGDYDFDYLNHGELSAELAYAVGEAVTVTPAVLYSAPLSQEAEDAGVDDEVVASLSVGYSF